MTEALLFHFVNQKNYSHVKYPTTISPEMPLKEPYPSVAEAGCGLCSAVMMVERLTGKRLSVEEAIDFSVQAEANRDGTDMKKLSKKLCEAFPLSVRFSNRISELKDCLETGGCAIINAGKTNGLFSDGGHFLLAFQYEEQGVWLADPSFSEDKYHREERSHQVHIEPPLVLASLKQIEEQCSNREPAYYLFQGVSL